MLKQAALLRGASPEPPQKPAGAGFTIKMLKRRVFSGSFLYVGQLCLAAAYLLFRKFPLREEISFGHPKYCRPECLELKETCKISRLVFP